MRFSDAFLEEIRQRLPIHEVVGEQVIWDKRKSQPGRGDYWACCPFHGEKTPSFHADDRKGIYHCFGCGKTGDHFRFLTEKVGMSFPEAVEKLAGMAGVAIPARDERTEAREEVRRNLYDVMEVAAQYFEAALSHNIGARARGYLVERQVRPEAQTRFRIGFAPDSRNGLKEHLAANGVTAQEMIDTGLVVTGDDVPVPYDRFRNRVMFPITDFRGRIVAFGGRALSADVPAKYLNSPETPIFSKRLVLYNGNDARKAARDGKPVIVVEGYLDVISSVMAGFEGTVAPMGTALTEDHMGLLWKMSDAPVLCFDGDAAGQRATERVTGLVLPLLAPGKTIKIATLPEGVDPDDLIRQQGKGAFGDVIDRARSLSDVVWSLETSGGIVPETPEARAALESRLKERANAIADVSVRRHYLQAFDEKLAAFFQPIRPQRFEDRKAAGRSNSRNRGYPIARNPKAPIATSDALKNSGRLRRARLGGSVAPDREAAILLTLINHPELAHDRLEALAQLGIQTPEAGRVLEGLLDVIMSQHSISAEDLRAALGARGLGPDIARMEALLRGQGVWQILADAAEIDAETGLRHALALHYKSVELNKALKAAENALDVEWTEDSFKVLQDIKNQITTVDGTEALIEGFGSLSGRAGRGF